MTKRQELEQKVFNIITSDMQSIPEGKESIWKEIKAASDASLIIYIAEYETEKGE